MVAYWSTPLPAQACVGLRMEGLLAGGFAGADLADTRSVEKGAVMQLCCHHSLAWCPLVKFPKKTPAPKNQLVCSLTKRMMEDIALKR